MHSIRAPRNKALHNQKLSLVQPFAIPVRGNPAACFHEYSVPYTFYRLRIFLQHRLVERFRIISVLVVQKAAGRMIYFHVQPIRGKAVGNSRCQRAFKSPAAVDPVEFSLLLFRRIQYFAKGVQNHQHTADPTGFQTVLPEKTYLSFHIAFLSNVLSCG